jgi:hypothetical protein
MRRFLKTGKNTRMLAPDCAGECMHLAGCNKVPVTAGKATRMSPTDSAGACECEVRIDADALQEVAGEHELEAAEGRAAAAHIARASLYFLN